MSDYSYNGLRFRLTDFLPTSTAASSFTTFNEDFTWTTYTLPSYDYARIYSEQSKRLWESFYKDLERHQMPWIRKISLNKNTTII